MIRRRRRLWAMALTVALAAPAAPARAAGWPDLKGIWSWLTGWMPYQSSHIDPNGATATSEQGFSIDPDGATATSEQSGYIDPNGATATSEQCLSIDPDG